MSQEQVILQNNLLACRQRIEKLKISIRKTKLLIPLKLETIQTLTDEQQESFDALILRYSQIVSMMQDHLFRGIAYIEQENISGQSNRDKTLLMEKLGVINSADDFGIATVLRNKFAHHYPEELTAQVERLNLVHQQAEYIIDVYQQIAAYLKRKKL